MPASPRNNKNSRSRRVATGRTNPNHYAGSARGLVNAEPNRGSGNQTSGGGNGGGGGGNNSNSNRGNEPMSRVLRQYIKSQGGVEGLYKNGNYDISEMIGGDMNRTQPIMDAQNQVGRMRSYLQDNLGISRQDANASLLGTLQQSNRMAGIIAPLGGERPVTPASDILNSAYSQGQQMAAQAQQLKQQEQQQADSRVILENVVMPKLANIAAIKNASIDAWEQGQYERAARIEDPDRQYTAANAASNLAAMMRMKAQSEIDNYLSPFTQGQKGSFANTMSQWTAAENATQNRFQQPANTMLQQQQQINNLQAKANSLSGGQGGIAGLLGGQQSGGVQSSVGFNTNGLLPTPTASSDDVLAETLARLAVSGYESE